MLTKKRIIGINIILLLALTFSAATQFSSPDNPTGMFYKDDIAPDHCTLNRNGTSHEIPIQNCCRQAAEMLSCGEEPGCFGTENFNYTLSKDAVKYCQTRGFRVE